jgi:glycosyltransferase involved in cell wall biosynthesis
VPLTPRTRAFLEAAGCCLGPTIPHCVDTALFRPAQPDERLRCRRRLGIDDDTLVVGTVGANTARKRFDRLVEAFALLARRPALLLVKTDRASSPGGFDLQALARRHGAAGRVRVLADPLPAADLAGLYAALDVYVHAAEWEGFGIPVAEAMACGVPVAAADTQGPGEVLPYREGLVGQGEWTEQEGGSRLFHVDPGALARAVDRMAGDRGLYERAAALGREEAVRAFDVGVVAARWLALLLGPGVESRP